MTLVKLHKITMNGEEKVEMDADLINPNHARELGIYGACRIDGRWYFL